MAHRSFHASSECLILIAAVCLLPKCPTFGQSEYRRPPPLPPAVIARFAPEIRLHSREVNYPASVDWYISRCELRFISHHDEKGLWQKRYAPSPLSEYSELLDKHSPDKLAGDPKRNTGEPLNVQGRYSSVGRRPGRGNWREDFVIVHLNRDADHTRVTRIGLDGLVGARPVDRHQRTGYFAEVEKALAIAVPAYVWVHYTMAEEGIYDLAFHLFRAYQGPTATRIARPFIKAEGQHEGDWERVVVRIREKAVDDYEIVAVYYSAHAREGGWYMPMSTRRSTSGRGLDFAGSGDPGRRRGFDHR